MSLPRKVLSHESLEERQLLAVDVFGHPANFGNVDDDHDSCCVSNVACCETIHLSETVLVSQALLEHCLLEETAQYYSLTVSFTTFVARCF